MNRSAEKFRVKCPRVNSPSTETQPGRCGHPLPQGRAVRRQRAVSSVCREQLRKRPVRGRQSEPSRTRQGGVDGTVENVATAKHVKFAAAANSVAGEHVKKVAELLGLLGCYDIIQWFIFRLSQYINTVAAAHLIDTTPRRKNKDEVPVKKDDDPPWDELDDKASSTGANSFTGNAYWLFIDFAAFLMALRTPERFVEAFRLLDKVLVFDGCGTFPLRMV